MAGKTGTAKPGKKPATPEPIPRKGKPGAPEAVVSAQTQGPAYVNPVEEAQQNAAPKPQPGPWESGAKTGKWEQGATGQWKQGAVGKWKVGTEGGGGFGEPAKRPFITGSRFDARGGTNPTPVNYHNSEFYDGQGDNLIGGQAAGGGGGGGTGSPFAPGLAEAVKATGVKSSEQLKGISVEETVKGARRTKKTGGKRTL
jgi:hypothetical protein